MLEKLTLTASAATYLQKVFDKTPEALGVRFGIQKTGCSGYGYTVELAHEALDEDDHWKDDSGLTLLVKQQHWPFLRGVEVDYAQDGLNQRLVYRNPNQTAACGCGESFTITPLASMEDE